MFVNHGRIIQGSTQLLYLNEKAIYLVHNLQYTNLAQIMVVLKILLNWKGHERY